MVPEPRVNVRMVGRKPNGVLGFAIVSLLEIWCCDSGAKDLAGRGVPRTGALSGLDCAHLVSRFCGRLPSRNPLRDDNRQNCRRPYATVPPSALCLISTC